MAKSVNSNNQQSSQLSIGSFIASAFFIIAGIVTLYDTMSYSDIDSKVFPRAAAIVLIICATHIKTNLGNNLLSCPLASWNIHPFFSSSGPKQRRN